MISTKTAGILAAAFIVGSFVALTALSTAYAANSAQFKLSKPVNISRTAGTSVYQDIITVGKFVYVAWMDGDDATGSFDIYFKASHDGGKTWGEIDDMGDVFTMRRSSVPQIAATGNTIFLVTTSRVFNTGDDVFLARSTSNGDSWSKAVNLSKQAGESRYPQIAM